MCSLQTADKIFALQMVLRQTTSKEVRKSIHLYSILIYNIYNCAKYFINSCLFSSAVVVGLPKSSLAPMEHLTSIMDN